MITAYFIGGSEDLTKRILQESLPLYYFNDCNPIHLEEGYQSIGKIEKLVYRCHGPIKSPALRGDVWIYVYEGVAQQGNLRAFP
jgi:hypothetical protein